MTITIIGEKKSLQKIWYGKEEISMEVTRSYRYLIMPDAAQKQKIRDIIRLSNKAFNMYMEEVKNGSRQTRVTDIVKRYKNICPEFKSTDTSALYNALFQATDKIEHPYFRRNNVEVASYTTAVLERANNAARLYEDKEILYLPYVGDVKIKMHRPLPENIRIKTFTVKKDNDTYYGIVTFVKNVLNAFDSNLDLKNSIGLDYSSSCFAVDNHGLRYDVPHFLRSNLDSIKKMMICLEKYEKGSDDYNAIIRKLRKLHRKIANRRKDFLHKLSCEIAENYDYVFVEDLDMNQYTDKSNLSRATYDNSYAKFVNMLQYKLEDKGKKLVKVSRYFASSKICSECGCLNENLKLNEKSWTCPHCGSYLDRDVNATVNIRKEGMRKVKEESWNQ